MPVANFVHDATVQMAPSRNGAAVLVEARVAFLDVTLPPRLTSIDVPMAPAPLSHPITLASAGGRLWVSYADGRICSVEGQVRRCYGPDQGLVGGPWYSLLASGTGALIAGP